MKLKDRVAAVTGSVRGLGWEMVQAFAQEGAKVVICDLDQADVDGAVKRLSLPAERVLGNELPRSKLTGYQNKSRITCSIVTPACL